jgi:hypothetical protein
MKYMLVLIGDESQYADWSQEDIQRDMQRWDEYTKQLVAAGAFVSGEGLGPSANVTTLRIQNGERILTDGPFAETKEQIGGFYVIEAKDLDEAIDWAAKLPSAEYGVTEIRPVMDYEAAGMDDTQPAQQGAAS